MEEVAFDDLVTTIADATRKALIELFESGERFYYFALITNSDTVLAPFVSAWSWESLAEEMDDEDNEDYDEESLKWSWADSPYNGFGNADFGFEEHFEKVKSIWGKLPDMGEIFYNDELNDDESHELWEKHFNFRIDAMVAALKQLDDEGMFAKKQPREEIFVNVEVMDGYENIKRALLLNPESTVQEYLVEGYYSDDGRR